MKKILFLFILFLGQNLIAQEWKLITSEADGTEYYYKPNSYDTAWIKQISDKTVYFSEDGSKKKTVDGYSLILWRFDCSNRQIGIVQKHTYSKDGKNLDSMTLKNYQVEMKYVIPDSIGESLLQSFCNK